MFRRGFALAASLVVAGCGASTSTRWNQIHSDLWNSSFNAVGPRTLADPLRFAVGDPGTSSPVEMPDGSILVSVYSGTDGLDSRIVRISADPNSNPPFSTFATSRGQISTPAVDSQGNVYVVVNKFGYPATSGIVELASLVVKFDPMGNMLWQVPTLSRPYLNAAPKLIEIDRRVSLFVPTREGPISQVLAVDGDGNARSVPSCGEIINAGGVAQPTPSAAPKPYREDPTFALARDGNGTPHLVDASTRCGIVFFRLAALTTSPPNWPTGLLFPNQITTVSSNSDLGTAAAEAYNGYALVGNGTELLAYDFTTGDEQWDYDTVLHEYLPPAVALNSMVMKRQSELRLLPISQPTTTPYPSFITNRPSAIAMTLGSVYLLGRDGVAALNTQLQQQSFFAISNNTGGGLAVLANGSLVASSRNGTTYVFPPN